jgi:flagellar basal-body rod protein FlgG
MLQGLYAAASGMEAQQTECDAISNDLANLNTPGYQQTEVGFQDLLYSGGGSASGSSVATGTGAASSIVGRSQTEGALQTTGDPLNIAISGPGFIQVRRPDGSTGLTRNGTLQLDAQGQLTDQQGNPLVPPIQLPKGMPASQMQIAATGTVTAGGRTLGRIAVVDVPAPTQLQPDGGSLFSVTAGSGATRPVSGTVSTIKQGALEGSNVDAAQAMTDMIDAQRDYQMSSQAIQYQDQMLQIADQLRK